MIGRLQNHPRLLATIVIGLALAVGALAGATIDRAFIRNATVRNATVGKAAEEEGHLLEDRTGPGTHHEMMRGPMTRPLGPGMRAGDRYLDRLTSDLDLSPEQRTTIEEILREQEEKIRELRREERRWGGAIVAETRSAILDILTPAQRATLERTGHTRGRGPSLPPSRE